MKTFLPSLPRKAIRYFVFSYWIVTILGISLTIAFMHIFNPLSAEELGVPFSQAPTYLMTVPYHPLLNLFWLLFAWLYLRNFTETTRWPEAIKHGRFWVITCILIDLTGWVLIPHPWAMTLKEFCIDYQSWTTLIYLVIFASPLVVSGLMKSKRPTNVLAT